MLLSAAQEEAGQQDDAIRTLELTLEENPEFFRATSGWRNCTSGSDVFRTRRMPTARRRLRTAAPTSGARRAASLINAGKPARGARDPAGRHRTARPPPTPACFYMLAQSQRLLKDFDGASATAQKLKAAFPNDCARPLPRGAAPRRSRAQGRGDCRIRRTGQAIAGGCVAGAASTRTCSRRAGRVADAERALRDLLAKDPLDANTLNSLGYLLADHGQRLDEAVDLVERALKVEPGNPSFLDSLGWAYYQQGKLDRADPPLTEAASKAAGQLGDPGSPRRPAIQAAAVCRCGRRVGAFARRRRRVDRSRRDREEDARRAGAREQVARVSAGTCRTRCSRRCAAAPFSLPLPDAARRRASRFRPAPAPHFPDFATSLPRSHGGVPGTHQSECVDQAVGPGRRDQAVGADRLGLRRAGGGSARRVTRVSASADGRFSSSWPADAGSTLVMPRDARVLKARRRRRSSRRSPASRSGPPICDRSSPGAACRRSPPSGGRSFGNGWAAVDAGDTSVFLRQIAGRWRVAGALRGGVERDLLGFRRRARRDGACQAGRHRGRPAADLTLRLSQLELNPPLDAKTFEVEVPR